MGLGRRYGGRWWGGTAKTSARACERLRLRNITTKFGAMKMNAKCEICVRNIERNLGLGERTRGGPQGRLGREMRREKGRGDTVEGGP
eukprot:scaffold29917_cov36-Tisochrysis_lutea.AAC.5